MSELSQAERIAALEAKRADRSAKIEPLTFAETVAAPDAPPPNPARDQHRITISRPTPQRVVATGVSVVSFAAMTVAMGPLTAQTAQTDEGDDAQVVASFGDQTIAQVPAAPPEVVVEVVPNYVAVSEDGTPIPDVNLRSDGTVAAPAPASAPQAAAPVATAAPATPKAAAPVVTAAPATQAPATTAAPQTTQAPATTAAPTTTAAAATTPPPPPPKSEASG